MADRAARFAKILGRGQVIAETGWGLSPMIRDGEPATSWVKLRSRAELATEELFGPREDDALAPNLLDSRASSRGAVAAPVP